MCACVCVCVCVREREREEERERERKLMSPTITTKGVRNSLNEVDWVGGKTEDQESIHKTLFCSEILRKFLKTVMFFKHLP